MEYILEGRKLSTSTPSMSKIAPLNMCGTLGTHGRGVQARSFEPRRTFRGFLYPRGNRELSMQPCALSSWAGRGIQYRLGVGRQQHVIVSQGNLDAILNARPEERRLVIEEAAGVLKYRRRKEKARKGQVARWIHGFLDKIADDPLSIDGHNAALVWIQNFVNPDCSHLLSFSMKLAHASQVRVCQNVAVENPKLRVRRCPFTVSEQCSSTAKKFFFLSDSNLQTMTILLYILFHGGGMGMRVDQDFVDPVLAAEIEPNPKEGDASDG